MPKTSLNKNSLFKMCFFFLSEEMELNLHHQKKARVPSATVAASNTVSPDNSSKSKVTSLGSHWRSVARHGF